ncbi:MAG: hypothetical protein PVJ66_07635, partial [Gammaproteobacteria bacterium]
MEKILDLRWLVISACLVALALFICMRPALAVDGNGAFELDGNAVQDAVPPPDDWETLYGGGGSATAFTEIVPDRGAIEGGGDTIFTGGGSKTPNLIGDWDWKINPEPPAKDDITNAYAANYNVAGEQVIYFGADLYAQNGDAELAFWFFQNEVALTPDPAEGATQGTFIGNHVDEDPYVAVKFSGGGTIANITVFEWWADCDKQDVPGGNAPLVAGDCAADNIRVVIPEGPATCDGSGGKIACAITNDDSTETAPWPYESKDGNPNFPPDAFFEGGINIFETFGENKCFSAFAAVTGASTSFTATAKDFVLDDFNVCSVAATKTCVNDDETDDLPANITYNVRGCGYNDGGGSINITGLLNSIASGANATPADLAWYDPGMVDDGGGLRDFDPATDCDDADLLKQAVDNGSIVADPSTLDLAGGAALVYQFSESTAMNGVSDTVTLSAEGADGTPIDAATDTATCPLRTFNADLNVTKRCTADLVDAGSALQVQINVQGMVCNKGEVTLTGLQLTDSSSSTSTPPSGVSLTPASTTLAPEGETGDCTSYTGSYTPESIPTGDTCPFSDVVDASATAPVNSTGTNCTLNGDGITSTCTASSNSATCLLRATDGDGDCATGPLS